MPTRVADNGVDVARLKSIPYPYNFGSVKEVSGATVNVEVHVNATKFDKHMVGDTLPATQSGKRTGLIWDQDLSLPDLYARFASDLIDAYMTLEHPSRWIKLQYAAEELDLQVFAVDVNDAPAQAEQQGYFQVGRIEIGGAVTATVKAGLAVYIDHGPLAFPRA